MVSDKIITIVLGCQKLQMTAKLGKHDFKIIMSRDMSRLTDYDQQYSILFQLQDKNISKINITHHSTFLQIVLLTIQHTLIHGTL